MSFRNYSILKNVVRAEETVWSERDCSLTMKTLFQSSEPTLKYQWWAVKIGISLGLMGQSSYTNWQVPGKEWKTHLQTKTTTITKHEGITSTNGVATDLWFTSKPTHVSCGRKLTSLTLKAVLITCTVLPGRLPPFPELFLQSLLRLSLVAPWTVHE